MRRALLPLILLISLVVSACVTAPPPGTAPLPAEPGPEAAAVPAGELARESIVVALPTDISTLNPYRQFSKFETSVSDHVLQYLTFRARDMSVEPLLATEWERLDDATWELKLREGVQFSNGEPFNAEAAKYSLDVLAERYDAGEPLGHASVAVPSAEIEQVDVIDDYTIQITTGSPKALLPFYLTQMAMVAPEFYSQASESELANEMIGTGPYVVAERVRDSHVTLRVSPDYWGPPPSVDEITFRVIPETSTQLAELETGGVDIVLNLPIDQAQVLQNTPGVHVATVEGGRRVLVGITTDGGPEPLEDRRVRQALNYAIDFDAISEGLFLGRARRMSYVFNPPYANTNLEPYPYDPDMARELLAEAGYPDGFQLQRFITPIGRWIQDFELAQAVKADLEEIGITFEEGLVTFEWGVYREKLLGYDLPGLFMQASGGEFEAAAEAADLTITSPSDFYRWNNPDYEALWEELQGELDLDRRYEIALEMQEIIREDAPWIFLYIQLDTYGVSDRIDWEPRMDEMVHLWDVNIQQ